MAIQRMHVGPDGASHPDAYLRVNAVEVRGDGAQVRVDVWHNVAARNDGELRPVASLIFNASTQTPADREGDPPIDDFSGRFGDAALTMAAASPIKAGYAFIKAQGLTGIDV